MNPRRWWLIGILIFAHGLGFFAIGLCQFGFSPGYIPGYCIPFQSPWERSRHWFAHPGPDSFWHLFEDVEVSRFWFICLGLAVTGVGLGVSLFGLPRVRPRLRLSTLMIVFAILPVECKAGEAAWEAWRNWVYHQGSMPTIGDLPRLVEPGDPFER
jgi:hypothetical protein